MSGVFLKVLNMSITASFLIAAVILLRLLLKKAPKWVTCLLWAVVAVRLICPFSIESVLSLVPTDEPVPMNIMMAPRPTIETGIAVIDNTVNPVISESMAPGVGDSVNPLQVVTFVAAIVWVVGIAVLIIYAIVSWLRLRRQVAVSVKVGDGVMACDSVDSPFILGVFKPVIYVPSYMSGETLESVLRHESAHLTRKDHWWKPLGFLLLTVYWFNPLCWAAYILLCRDIELACDEKVIRDMNTTDKAAYSQALLDCSVNRARVAACPLAFGEVGVKERVKSVLNYKKPAFWVIVCAVVACVVVAVCFMTKAKSEEPDLSFLNYKNVMSTTAEIPDVFSISHDETSSEIMYADGSELAQYLGKAAWKKSKAPRESLPSANSVEFQIAGDYRITVYKNPQRAKVEFQGDVRYYKTAVGDYEAAKALLHKEVSAVTEPAGKIYTWEKEGFGSPFTLTLYDDGTFQYYVGAFSSHIGTGTWQQDGSLVTLTEDEKMTGYAGKFVFEAKENSLIFKENESTPFGGVKVEDGDCFNVLSNVSEAVYDDEPADVPDDVTTDAPEIQWPVQSVEYKPEPDEGETVLNTYHYDINQDGTRDTIVAVSIGNDPTKDFKDTGYYWGQIKVYNGAVTYGDGTAPIWVIDWATAHAGNIQVFTTNIGGVDYLVVTSLYEGQGSIEYLGAVLYWDKDKMRVIKSFSYENGQEYGPADFFNRLYSWINDNSVLILATDVDTEPMLFFSQENNLLNPKVYYSLK